MRWGIYNKLKRDLYDPEKFKVVPIDRVLYDPEMEAVYSTETHRLIEKFAWDPENFETREELETYLTEYLGFEPEPEGIIKKPMTFDWETDVAEEVVVLDRQVSASKISPPLVAETLT